VVRPSARAGRSCDSRLCHSTTVRKKDLPFYRMVDLQVPKYLIIYTVVTADVGAVFKEINRRIESGETVISMPFQ
jgi:hypothetical protein